MIPVAEIRRFAWAVAHAYGWEIGSPMPADEWEAYVEFAAEIVAKLEASGDSVPAGVRQR
jgi:hypothetical protein